MLKLIVSLSDFFMLRFVRLLLQCGITVTPQFGIMSLKMK